ncbi:MAG TPA: xanthine dehydrogenase family protein molybdopterin-binding subunit [Xanthobacteraceae bacterium]|jgi:carbon-monoxide dehydrogenase large subunit
MRSVNTYIGRPMERVEDLRFLRGQGQYIGDLEREGQWHAAIVRSQVAFGRIRKIDGTVALTMPGVHAVITAADISKPVPTIPFRRKNPSIAPYAQPVIAAEYVRYVGEPVAVVLAASAELAEDAAETVTVEMHALPPCVDWQASTAGTNLLFPGTNTNIASTFTARCGDANAAFAGASYTRRERFRIQRHTALPLETRGLLAEWHVGDNRLTIYGAAKLPFFNRRAMAAMMGLPETSVDYIELDVGGGFGARGEFYPEDFLIAFAARKFSRPVKWIEDRREHFTAIGHARQMDAEIEIACQKDGTMVAMRGTMHVDIGAYVRPNGMTPVRNVIQFTTAPYRISNLDFAAHGVLTNKTPAGTYRGPGRFEGCFFCERMIDIAAREMGIDPVEMRRRNLLTNQDMPYALVSIAPDDGFGDTECDSGDYHVTFERCLQEFGWNDKKPLAGKLLDGRYHGIGIGCFIEGGASGPRESARVEVTPDGKVDVYVGSSSIGQGIETIMAQIAADALEIPMDDIRVLHGSTNYLKEGFGSYGSRATVMGGSAVMLAVEHMLKSFRQIAARKFAIAVEEVFVSGSTARARDGRSMTMAEAAAVGRLTGEGTYSSNRRTYTYGTAAAHVAVDPKTGSVKVLDYVVVDDVGRAINPLTLHGQVVGAAVQGFGGVFSENLVYDANGQLLIGSLADYQIPLTTDYPHIRAITLEQFPAPHNPLGAKGAGEGGIIPVGAAISNAIASALSSFNVQPTDLPLTPPRLWELIEKARP